MRGIGRITAAVLAAGLVVTALLTWAASRAYEGNEERLLDEQAEEAAAVLQAAVPRLTSKAEEAARVAAILQSDPAALEASLQADVAEDDPFSAITVDRTGSSEPIAVVGSPSAVDAELRREVTDALSEDPTLVTVTGRLRIDDPRLVYSTASVVDPSVVVHAERRLNPQRVNDDREGEAFDRIHIALYLGDEEDPRQLLLASTAELPLEGPRAERTIPLGDKELKFVVSPAGTLGGGLLRAFPWLTAVAGLLSTAIATVLVESLHRRRRDAEAFTAELRDLYRREHAIAHTLQHSLLPTHLDRLEGIEIAARYFAGAEGTDIGGDWYDVINHDRGFTVVVGDVVGRGVQAASVMAAMRYGTHAVAGQTTDPAEVLAAVNGLEHIRGDFVTMLCGAVDPSARTVAFASAGHPAPLLISGGNASFVDLRPGPPIGFLDGTTYGASTATMPAGSVLVLFTDGLYERRGESIEVGLERLRQAASSLSGSVDDIVDGLAGAMLGDTVRDDTAMLAFRLT